MPCCFGPRRSSDLDRLAMVWETDRNTGTTREPASLPDYLDFKARSRTFEDLAAVMAGRSQPDTGARRSGALAHAQHHRQRAARCWAFNQSPAEPSPRMRIGPEDRRSCSSANSCGNVRSIGVRTRSDRRCGSTIVRTMIVGVMPDGADFGVLQILSAAAYSRGFADRGMRSDVDIWMPMQGDVHQLPRSTHPIFVIGRLAPAVDARGGTG